MVLHPVILSGGAGTRLWPVSRADHPKQLLPLVEPDRSLFQATVARASGDGFAAPVVVCNDAQRFIIAEQLRALGMAADRIMVEPVARDTAPAVAAAALHLAETAPDTPMMVQPSDHVITDTAAFHAALERAGAAARAGWLVTFGITPDHPATGYGYIKAGDPVPDAEGVWRVARFVEKPDRATAEAWLAEGGYAWNSGIFVFTPATLIAELDRHAPAVLAAARAALAGARGDLDFCRLAADAFAGAPAISLDYAVMEATDRAAVVPAGMGWRDVGAWPAVWDLGTGDADGNVTRGDVLLEDSRNCYVHADDHLTAVAGLEDTVVVVTDDAVLVAGMNHGQAVKQVVDRLKAAGRVEHQRHTTVHRPWGAYRHIDDGARYQVKRLTVRPGAGLSLQMHHHRAEHWVVVRGTARVERDGEDFLLRENESTDVPIGARHRLSNPGTIPLEIIEVQSGSYLGEDDIIRLDDSYGREGE